MAQKRKRINARMPEPNDNFSMTVGNKVIVDAVFRDLKHGIDWRPARCTKEESIKGRILISFLALFCMSMIRFLYPQFRSKTAESISEELSSFTLTVFTKKNGEERRVWSNFGPILRAIFGRERSVPVPKAHGQTVLDGF